MAFLRKYKSLARSEEQRERQDKVPQSTTSNPQQAVGVDPPQRPPESIYVPAAINDQPTNPGNTELNALQELPVTTTNDRVTDTGVPIPTHSQHLTSGQSYPTPQYPGMDALRRLEKRTKFAAMHDSFARTDPPRCHPATRKTLRSRIYKWGRWSESDENMLWVVGPPAVGKSAVAQTIAEEFREMNRLGASFFFSRPNHLDDPDWVIPTLAYQLATVYPPYRGIIAQLLVDYPSILEKNRSTQFEKLIIEPFRALVAEDPDIIQEPLLVILDGLDECKDKQAQREFVNLISTRVRQVGNFPLLWLICSRPEWHLDEDLRAVCKREELRVYDKEAQRDVERVLRDGLDKIRNKYRDRLPVDWPPEDYFQRIASATSGHLGLVSSILRFMEDEEYGDPDGQFQVCMKCFHDGSTVSELNPFQAFDLLYHHILSSVPAKDLRTTKRILGLLITDFNTFDSATEQAAFLDLDRVTFRRSLQYLHSVIYVPPVNDSDTIPLRIHHASFSDFLMDSNRSGEYWLNKEAMHCDFARQCLHWVDKPHNPNIPTFHESADEISCKFKMIQWCTRRAWYACHSLRDDSIPSLISQLEHFDFEASLPHLRDRSNNFFNFFARLHSLGSTHNTSVITPVQGVSQEQTSKEPLFIHCPPSPHSYITSFFPSITAPVLPFFFQLRLGKTAPVHIALAIVERETDVVAIQFLRDALYEVLWQSKDHLSANWPSQADLVRVAVAAPYVPHITSFLIRFIGDASDPDGQLKICVKLLGGGNTVATTEASHTLDPFYRHILSNVPARLFPAVRRVLGLLIAHPYGLRSFDNQARFLNLDRAALQESLQCLHPAVHVPPMDKYNTVLFRIYHKSLSSFLTDVSRSGEYLLTKAAAKYDFVLQCLRCLEDDDGSPSNKDVIKFCASEGWDTCHQLSDDFVPAFIEFLEQFNFSRLKYAHIVPDNPYQSGFGKFLQWLYSLGTTRNKSVITLVQGNFLEHTSKEIPVTHRVASPYDYIASFIPNVSAPASPADARLLRLRLGKSAPVHTTLTVVDDKTQNIIRCLQDGIGKIRQQFHDRLPTNWPLDSDLLCIAAAVHGDHNIASFLIRFIGDATHGDPDGQLKVCIELLGSSDIISTVNPPNILQVDPFYRRILSGIPHSDLPATLWILELTIKHRYGLRSCDNQAKFLDLDQARFHQLLQRLCSVVYVPPMDGSNTILPRIYHTSFSDFLVDPNRSGEYWLNKEMDYEFVRKCLHWLEHHDGPTLNRDVIGFCASQVWDACRKLSDDFIPALISRLEYYDFTRLKHAHTMPDGSYESSFGKFLQWLYSLGRIRNKFVITLVREIPEDAFQRIQVEHRPSSLHAYLASFIPDIQVTAALPYTLRFRLGKAARVYITLVVVG